MTESPGRALLFFVDGVGIGDNDPRYNPFATAHLPTLRGLLGGRLPVMKNLDSAGRITGAAAVLTAADATLGVPGLPQSGTGQSALLTGDNSAQRFGRHFGPWVPVSLREGLERDSLLSRTRDRGLRPSFANAYPQPAVGLARRPAAPPLAARAAGVLTRGAAELIAGRAVASSLTNQRWRAHSKNDIPDVSADAAGRTLGLLAAEADLTLFAHYDTDYIGHRGDLAAAASALEKLDGFLFGLLESLTPDTLLVLASDHGNIEDVRGGHTRNRVPVLARGPGAAPFAAGVRAITDVAPALLRILRTAPPPP